jgi:sulfur carrier protein
LTLTLTINGAQRVTDPGTVQDYLTRSGIESRAIAVERNGEIVPRRLFSSTHLADGDRLEIVRITGGG